jgi:FtsP/CotA-like multicopper oxidase with cupredoxin domain
MVSWQRCGQTPALSKLHYANIDRIWHVWTRKQQASNQPTATQAYVDTNCTDAPLPFHLVAADGLTMAAAVSTQVAVFQPGCRWDALVHPSGIEGLIILARGPRYSARGFPA